MTPNESLDEALKYIGKSYGNENEKKYSPKEMTQIVRHMQKFDKSLEDIDVGRIVDKLIKDERVEKRVVGSEFLYFITFDGKVFLEDGGYRQRAINDVSESTRLERMERAQTEYQTNTILLTIILAVGALIPAAPYLIKLLKYLHWIR